ncbi:hypothetical protein HWV62_34157 [Athelia sp. TMB]|nr:hypothetical protein HWV62_34157 [Athelia sp. TMB]
MQQTPVNQLDLDQEQSGDLETRRRDAPIPDIYDKFSKSRKQAIVAVVAFAALLAPFASSAFLPSIPQISHDLNTSEAAINYTVAAYLVIIGLAPLVWSSYATMCSIGVAESRTLIQLIFTRMIQGIGASSVLSVGAGSIGDIYRPTERGRAMGLYLAGAQLGPPLAPVIGGIMTEYAHGSRGTWRAFQYLLAAMGLLTFVFAIVFLPETSHSRGIDEMKAAGRKGFCGTDWVWLNPLRPLGLLRFKHVLAIVSFFGCLLNEEANAKMWCPEP